MTEPEIKSFENASELESWLENHHETKHELWVKIFKKKSGIPSVDWNDCVIASIIWGWIDSQKKSLDDNSYLQRLTPRRPKSNWSKKNCRHVQELIDEGRMQPAGLSHVNAAIEDGRWENAYAGSADMVIPADFLETLETHPVAKQHYETLNRKNLFTIYHRLHTAKKIETRKRRLDAIIATLNNQDYFH